MYLMYLEFEKYLREVKPTLGNCKRDESLNVEILPSTYSTEEDYRVKHELHTEIFKPNYDVDSHLKNLVLSIESETGIGFVINVDNNPVGSVDVEIVNDFIYILNLGLIDNYRGKGLSKILLTSCIDFVIEKHSEKFKGIFLLVKKDNFIAKNLYESIGFEVKI